MSNVGSHCFRFERANGSVSTRLDGAHAQRSSVQWLTGELLISVRRQPEDILPYLNRDVSAHLDRPRLFVSLAKVEFDLNLVTKLIPARP